MHFAIDEKNEETSIHLSVTRVDVVKILDSINTQYIFLEK